MSNRTRIYIVMGVFLTYYGLSDEKFIIWYNGVALVLGISAFIAAYLEYKKDKNESEN